MSVLVARDLAKSYQVNGRNVPALRSASITVGPGEYVAITGPSDWSAVLPTPHVSIQLIRACSMKRKYTVLFTCNIASMSPQRIAITSRCTRLNPSGKAFGIESVSDIALLEADKALAKALVRVVCRLATTNLCGYAAKPEIISISA